MLGLEREQATYRQHLSDLIVNEGKYVVIKGDTILQHAFDSYEQALAAGYEKFGPGAFLVKQIHLAEPVMQFTRDLPRWDVSKGR